MEYTPSFRDQLQNGSKHSWRDDLADELYHHGISATAATSQAYNQHRANKAQRRINRLSN